MKRASIEVIGALLLFTSMAAFAQEKPATDPKPPALTEVQKLQIQNAAQLIELWQLKAQQAATEYDKARELFQKLIAQATPAGYVINDKLELVKEPAAAKPADKPKQ